MKKLIAMLTIVSLATMFASCGKEEPAPVTEPESTASVKVTETEVFNNDISVVTPTIKTADGSAVYVSENETEATTETTSSASDPSQWTKEEIISFYKAAAAKSNPTAKSNQVMVLNKLIINNGEGAVGFFTKILEPAIRAVVKKNALEFDGITGGFHDLSVNDTKSVKAYKSGEYTVIEMTLKNQTDDIHADQYAGSVGHAITVLGDIGRVIEEFPQFDVDLSNAKIDIHYVNASLKVKINKDGIIEKGNWQYTCDPDISNVKISGINVKTADAEIDYIITVGGGC